MWVRLILPPKQVGWGWESVRTQQGTLGIMRGHWAQLESSWAGGVCSSDSQSIPSFLPSLSVLRAFTDTRSVSGSAGIRGHRCVRHVRLHGPSSGPPSVVDTDGETKLSFIKHSARVQTRAFWGAEEGQGQLPLKDQEFAWRRWERDRVCVHSAVGGLLLRQRARCLGCGGEEGQEAGRTQALRAGLGQVPTGWGRCRELSEFLEEELPNWALLAEPLDFWKTRALGQCELGPQASFLQTLASSWCLETNKTLMGLWVLQVVSPRPRPRHSGHSQRGWAGGPPLSWCSSHGRLGELLHFLLLSTSV